MDGKYVLAAESEVIVKAECSQFCRLCHRDMGAATQVDVAGRSSKLQPHCLARLKPNSLPLDPFHVRYVVFVHILISGWETTEQTKEGSCHDTLSFPFAFVQFGALVSLYWGGFCVACKARKRGTTLWAHVGLGQLLGEEGHVSSQCKPGSCQPPRAVNSLSGLSSEKMRKLFNVNHYNC